MVEFWKRFPHNAIAALLAASSLVEDQDDHNDQNGVHKIFRSDRKPRGFGR